MKKITQFFFYFIFATFFSQKDEKIGIELQVNNEMDKAPNLSTNNSQNNLEIFQRTYYVSKNINNRSGMLKSNSSLMTMYFDTGNFQKVIDLSKEAEILAIQINDNDMLYQTFRLRASAYKKLGLSSESRNEFLKAYEVAKKIDSKNYKNYQRSHIYHGSVNYSADINRDKKNGDISFKNIPKERNGFKNNQKTAMILISIIITILLCFWIFWRMNQNKILKKYQTNIQLKEEKRLTEPFSNNREINLKNEYVKRIIITDETANLLLNKLQKFEQSKKFIKKEVNRVYLANYLQTNTKYLSEIIKLHTGKNFNNYINGLRIDYIKELLYNDPKYREYKISYLASECGFASREVFAVTFKKETGVTPSSFINHLSIDSSEFNNLRPDTEK